MQTKNSAQKALAFLLTAAMMLTSAGCASSKPTEENKDTSAKSEPNTGEQKDEVTSDKTIKDLVLTDLVGNELNTFNILNTQTAVMTNALVNLTDGLLEVNNEGKLIPGLAESWETKDNGKTWTFHIRDGVKWVDVKGEQKADCNAKDFATGLEWVLNYHKNTSINTSMPIEMIEGANEYYEYTKALTPEEAYQLNAGDGSKFLEMVGVSVPDDHTLVYSCLAEFPYFDTLSAYSCLYPAPQALIDELGVEGFLGMNNETMWYNGPYIMPTYVQNNEKVYEKNPMYWDTQSTRFDTVTVKMIESNAVAYQMYENDEIDYVPLGESQIQAILDNPNHKFADNIVADAQGTRVLQFHWNYSKNNKDGTLDTNWNTAAANEAFRLAWLYGLDLTKFYSRYNPIDPLSCEATAYIRDGFAYTSDGTDYASLVKEQLGIGDYNGQSMVRLDQDKAADYKKQAMEELSKIGVTFPVHVDYYISGSNQAELDTATVLKDSVSESLGDDFVVLDIKTYVSSQYQEVRDPGLHAFGLFGWGADYGDPQNLLGQETYGYDNAYFSQKWSRINIVEENESNKELIDTYKEFTAMVEKANAITNDLDARYQAYADAETYFIQHGLTMPCYVDKPLCLTKIDIGSKAFALYGGCNNKMKNWKTNSDGYTA